jgi:hypothetical protein
VTWQDKEGGGRMVKKGDMAGQKVAGKMFDNDDEVAE